MYSNIVLQTIIFLQENTNFSATEWIFIDRGTSVCQQSL